MKFKLNQRGFIFMEFAMALPLLILLLYALGTLILNAAKIAREQVADYVLETEAQEVIDRITQDAHAAYSVEIKKSSAGINSDLENIFFKCDSLTNTKEGIGIDGEYIEYYKRVIDPRFYVVDNAETTDDKLFHVYFKRQESEPTTPITGGNSYGKTFVTQMKFSVIAPKVLHITFEMQSAKRTQKVKFSTAVYMPGCKYINDKGTIYNYE